MCVAVQLGLDDPERGLIREAAEAWQAWGQLEPDLRVVDDLLDLPAWIKSADRDQVDEVLLALARLASPRGGDDVAAAGALAWLLLPGARAIAARLADLSEGTDRLDQVVASQLWIEVRSFEWERLGKVASNILRSTRNGVMVDFGKGNPLRRADPTWAATTVSEKPAHFKQEATGEPAPEPDPRAERLSDLVTVALGLELICRRDIHLLEMIAASMNRQDKHVTSRGRGGFGSTRTAAEVGAELGVSGMTVRRRAGACLRVLMDLNDRLPGSITA